MLMPLFIFSLEQIGQNFIRQKNVSLPKKELNLLKFKIQFLKNLCYFLYLFLVENYGLFPKQFGDIVSKFQIHELKLTLSQGTWKFDRWNLPIVSAPSGAELMAVFSDQLDHNEY